jgi:hypothetical protein
MAVPMLMMPMSMMVPVTVTMMVMAVILTQQPGAEQVDEQSDHRHGNGLLEADRNRAVEPHHTISV